MSSGQGKETTHKGERQTTNEGDEWTNKGGENKELTDEGMWSQ